MGIFLYDLGTRLYGTHLGGKRYTVFQAQLRKLLLNAHQHNADVDFRRIGQEDQQLRVRVLGEHIGFSERKHARAFECGHDLEHLLI